MTRLLATICFAIFTPLSAYAQICGPNIAHSTRHVDGKSGIEMNPPLDKALIYVLQPGAGDGKQHKVSMDRVWVGINQHRWTATAYFVFPTEPGTRDFCAEGDVPSHLTIDLEAGKTYYIQMVENEVGVTWTHVMSQWTLSRISEADAIALLKKRVRVIFWPKGAPAPKE
jgi:hypothetical protein